MEVRTRLRVVLALSCALASAPRTALGDPPTSSGASQAIVGDSAFHGTAKMPRERVVDSRFARAAIRAALSASRTSEGWARLESLGARSHSSALLPELIMRVARNTDESLRLSPTADVPYNYSAVGGAGWWIEGRLIWHLDRLVFNTHELGIERLRSEHSDRTGRLVNKVLATLFAWQRAVLRAADPGADDDERGRAELDAAEAEIVLDELTGGWFGRELARRRASE